MRDTNPVHNPEFSNMVVVEVTAVGLPDQFVSRQNFTELREELKCPIAACFSKD
jgi:hypothetical protein